MSVPSEKNKKVYACNGVTTEFSFPYKIFAQIDLKVYLRDTNDDLTLLTFTTHYTVSAVNNDYSNGAKVTTVTTYANGNTLTLLRVVPLTQGADYVENDNFPAEGHESALDRGVMISQQIDEAVDRVLQAPVDEEGVDMTLPTVTEREGGFLAFKVTTGEPIAASALNNDDIPVTAFAETLLDDETAKEARQTLIVPNLDIKTVSSADYTVLDDDGYGVILVTTGASDRTITLPTVTDNDKRQLKIVKVDDGAGKVIVDAEGESPINGTLIWEITQQYGYVTLVCNGTKWFVLNQQGCIYEMWDNADIGVTISWADYYNLSGLVPGEYLIEYGICLAADGITIYATIATAVDTEDDIMYTTGLFVSAGQAMVGYCTKSFMRTFAANTTLYLNAKESGASGNIRNNSIANGYIRATRIG